MMILLLAALAASQPPSAQSALRQCRPVLARKVGGQIATVAIRSSRRDSKGVTIKGRLTAFLGMGPPAPGSASAHHLIRTDFNYRCTVGRRGVRSASVAALR